MDKLNVRPEDVPASALPYVKSDPLGVKEYGEWLKALREEKGLTLSALAELTAYSTSHLSQIETGKKKKMPAPAYLEKLAGPLGVDYSDLLRMAGYDDLAKGVKWREAQEDFSKGGEEYDLLSLKKQVKFLEGMTDIKTLLERKAPPYPMYNGHKLTADERRRLLIILENVFEH